MTTLALPCLSEKLLEMVLYKLFANWEHSIKEFYSSHLIALLVPETMNLSQVSKVWSQSCSRQELFTKAAKSAMFFWRGLTSADSMSTLTIASEQLL